MFTPEQTADLGAPLSRANVKTRKQAGRQLSYLEGWVAIVEANRIFGFGEWDRETVEIRCVSEREREIGDNKLPGWGVTYICRVRVTVRMADGSIVVREGCGSGHGIDRDLGQAHESAIKEGETDSMKRCLMTFGNPFGLALYDKDQANVEDAPQAPIVRPTALPPPSRSVEPKAQEKPPAAKSEPGRRIPLSPIQLQEKSIEWAKASLANLENFIAYDKFDEWADANAEVISKIRDYDLPLHTKLTTAIKDTYQRLASLS